MSNEESTIIQGYLKRMKDEYENFNTVYNDLLTKLNLAQTDYTKQDDQFKKLLTDETNSVTIYSSSTRQNFNTEFEKVQSAAQAKILNISQVPEELDEFIKLANLDLEGVRNQLNEISQNVAAIKDEANAQIDSINRELPKVTEAGQKAIEDMNKVVNQVTASGQTLQQQINELDLRLSGIVNNQSNISKDITAIQETNKAIKASQEALLKLIDKTDDRIDQINQQIGDIVNIRTDIDTLKINKADKTFVTEQLAQSEMYGTKWIDIKYFGAVGNANFFNSDDGLWYEDESFNTLANDDTNAIKQAIQHAVNQSVFNVNRTQVPTVYVPSGKYRVTETGILNSFNQTNVQGLTMKGDGRNSSVMILDTSDEAWFYDNENEQNQKGRHFTFYDMQFTATDKKKGNWARLYSLNFENHFNVYDCVFDLGQLFDVQGTNNGDITSFHNSVIYAHKNMFTYNNIQSVVNLFFNCSIIAYSGLVSVHDKGGGDFMISGGSLIMLSDPDDVNNSYIIDLSDADNLGQTNMHYELFNVRVELRDETKRLVRAKETETLNGFKSVPAVVTFRDCNIMDIKPTLRPVVEITAPKEVYFINCSLSDFMEYHVKGTRNMSNNAPQAGKIKFIDCRVGSTSQLYSRCVIEEYGRIISTGSHMVTANIGTHTLYDFDMGWQNETYSGETAKTKIGSLLPIGKSFPGSSYGGSLTNIPKNAFIKKIHIFRDVYEGSEQSEPNYTLYVGSSDLSKVLGSVSLDAFGDKLELVIENVGVINLESIRIWATGSNVPPIPIRNTDYAYIEYI